MDEALVDLDDTSVPGITVRGSERMQTCGWNLHRTGQHSFLRTFLQIPPSLKTAQHVTEPLTRMVNQGRYMIINRRACRFLEHADNVGCRSLPPPVTALSLSPQRKLRCPPLQSLGPSACQTCASSPRPHACSAPVQHQNVISLGLVPVTIAGLSARQEASGSNNTLNNGHTHTRCHHDQTWPETESHLLKLKVTRGARGWRRRLHFYKQAAKASRLPPLCPQPRDSGDAQHAAALPPHLHLAGLIAAWTNATRLGLGTPWQCASQRCRSACVGGLQEFFVYFDTLREKGTGHREELGLGQTKGMRGQTNCESNSRLVPPALPPLPPPCSQTPRASRACPCAAGRAGPRRRWPHRQRCCPGGCGWRRLRRLQRKHTGTQGGCQSVNTRRHGDVPNDTTVSSSPASHPGAKK